MKNKTNQDLKGNSDPIASTPLAKLHSRLSNVQCVNIGSASSSGGKEPFYGPRRVVYPARQISDPFLAQTSKFLVSQDERHYYHILCRLASSKWKGLRCRSSTRRSLT